MMRSPAHMNLKAGQVRSRPAQLRYEPLSSRRLPWRAFFQSNRSLILACAVTGVVVGFLVAFVSGAIAQTQYLDMFVALGALGIAAAAAWRAARAEVKVELLEQHALAERSYEVFIDNAIEGFFRTTYDGKYLKVNSALARIYGYATPEQLMNEITDIGNSLYVDPAQRFTFMERMKTEGLVREFVSEIKRRDGQTIWITENARAVYDDQGQVLFYEGTVEDITTRIQTEEAMRRALQETQEAARAKSAFMAAMSHELKTPLNAVIGFSDLMIQETFGPIAEPHYAGYLVDIHQNGVKLLRMINDILDLTRVEGGIMKLDDELVALRDVIPGVCAAAVLQLAQPPAIETRIQDELPLLRADERRVRQILTYVLSNAVKFTPRDGVVSLDVARAPDGGVAVVISDTGIGISPDRISHALEPFKQLDTSLARRFEGVGLGLPLANAFTRLHGGTLTIRSVLNRGTVVTITFPPERMVDSAIALCA
jgi:PAS domain S-box-containing protein